VNSRSDQATPDPAPPPRRSAGDQSRRARIDRWMAENPWHPRLIPCLLYVLLLAPVAALSERWPQWYVVGYVVQCLMVAAILWRYRALTDELTLRFHWLAVPTGVIVAAAWIGIGDAMRQAYPSAEVAQHLFERLSEPMRGISLGVRLLGMSLLVPIFEELLIRSLILRSFAVPRWTGRALLGAMQELPMIGEWLTLRGWSPASHAPSATTDLSHVPATFADCFRATPMGKVTFFGAVVSTLFFMLNHLPVDWPGCIFCGVAYCALVAATHRRGSPPGLGPVIWAHGITNALLWAYCVWLGDWRFM